MLISKTTLSAFAFLSIVLLFLGGCVFFTDSFGKDEPIDQIEFRMSDHVDEDKVLATVYFVGKKERKKLSSGDLVTINDKPLKGESYSGIATGYKYSLRLERTNVYELKVVHNGKETKQQIQARSFSASLPSSFSINKDFEIPIKVDPEVSGRPFVEVYSIGREAPILTTDKYQRGLTLTSTEADGKMIITHAQLKNLKLGRAELVVSRMFANNYAITFKKEIDITE